MTKHLNYRHFQLTIKATGFEDFTCVDYLSEAKKVFQKFYPKHTGTVKEIFMREFSKNNLKNL